jgi:2-polyprenyl-3-methyl-5-hydroxy-6-metoxy-1,4-benzoquinol methylase
MMKEAVMENATAFWDDRVAKHGHTGWGSPMVYCYDQPLRLKVVDQIIGEITKFEQVLDYRCGVGDFSALLSKRSNKCIAYDISNTSLNIAKKSMLL